MELQGKELINGEMKNPTINDIIKLIEGQELTSYLDAQINALCINNGYFIHYTDNDFDGEIEFISNRTHENIAFFLIYRYKTRDILVKKYNRHITEDLNEGDEIPKDFEYEKTVKPVFFKYIEDGEENEAWIIDSKDFF